MNKTQLAMLVSAALVLGACSQEQKASAEKAGEAAVEALEAAKEAGEKAVEAIGKAGRAAVEADRAVDTGAPGDGKQPGQEGAVAADEPSRDAMEATREAAEKVLELTRQAAARVTGSEPVPPPEQAPDASGEAAPAAAGGTGQGN